MAISIPAFAGPRHPALAKLFNLPMALQHGLARAVTSDPEWADLVGYAGDLGLDVEQFVRDLSEGRCAERVREDVVSAEASGARGTPTFFVGEQRHIGAYDTETLAGELDALRSPAPA